MATTDIIHHIRDIEDALLLLEHARWEATATEALARRGYALLARRLVDFRSLRLPPACWEALKQRHRRLLRRLPAVGTAFRNPQDHAGGGAPLFLFSDKSTLQRQLWQLANESNGRA